MSKTRRGGNADEGSSGAGEPAMPSQSVRCDRSEDVVDGWRDRWLLGGAALLIALGMLATALWRSADFDHGSQSLLITVTLVHVAMGIVFLLLLVRGSRACRIASGRSLLLGMIVLGALLRVTAAPAAPGWEDDFYRYLWDGAVVSEGISAYAHPPDAATADDESAARLHALAAEAGVIHDRINHPHLRTIYPPLAQVSFAAAYQISPWSFNAWRFVVLLHDLATFALVLLILRSLGLPLTHSAIYWINPLLVKEFYQSAHMDALLLTWLMAAVLLAVRCRPVVSMAMLACATAVKLWPALLMPIILRRDLRRPVVMAVATGLFAIVAGALLAPMLLHEAAPGSGLTRYAEAWQSNAGFYALHHAMWHHALPLIGIEQWHSQQFARAATAALLVGWIGALCLRPIRDSRDLVRRCALAAIALFLISPTQFPWYLTWLIPLLALWPVRGMLLYVALLPLYHFQDLAPWVVWVQHVPVWAVLLYDGVDGWRHTSRSPAAECEHDQITSAITRPVQSV